MTTLMTGAALLGSRSMDGKGADRGSTSLQVTPADDVAQALLSQGPIQRRILTSEASAQVPLASPDPQLEGLGLPLPAMQPEMDIESLVLSQDFSTMAAVKKTILKVPIGKPPPQTWLQINANPDWQKSLPMIELKVEREHFVVAPAMRDELASEWTAKLLVAIITRGGAIMFWPIRLPGEDGKIDTWNESALEIVRSYPDRWIRMKSNREAGAYEVVEPNCPPPPPVWPADPQALFQIALRGRIITSAEHRVVKQLRGG